MPAPAHSMPGKSWTWRGGVPRPWTGPARSRAACWRCAASPGSGWTPLCRRHRVEIAIVNDVDRLVVGGRSADLIGFQQEVSGLGAGITPMMVSIASHTSLLNDAVPEFAALLGGSGLRAPVVPVLAGIDGGPVFTRQRAVDTLSRQIARTVQWAACIGACVRWAARSCLNSGRETGCPGWSGTGIRTWRCARWLSSARWAAFSIGLSGTPADRHGLAHPDRCALGQKRKFVGRVRQRGVKTDRRVGTRSIEPDNLITSVS